ncbi:hypothetical protein [Cohnella abietis]|uniref:Uncharacterized protein n=1 Tax=Cohnella abietis TaxID=2507935 RepID=A0A3T1D6Y6_9BACL|nr:hypothetical protein [Cohnella abietis]BBI33848.1 hypothetical protein KCTCHS21_32470 [Cohnella abietis]
MVDNGQDKINQSIGKQQKNVIGLIDTVLADVTQEIETRNSGTIGRDEIPSVLQLESISNELIKMKSVLSPNNYLPTYTRQIVDSWDIRSVLGDKLLGVAQEYKKLK